MTTRDWPDYNAPVGAVDLSPINDLGELLARLGIPAGVDRRGQAVGWYAFDGSYRGFIKSTSTEINDWVRLNTLYAEVAPTCLELSLSAVSSSFAIIHRDFPGYYGARVGVETGLLWPNQGVLVYIFSSIGSPTLPLTGAIRIDTTLHTVSYLSAAEGWVALSPVSGGALTVETWYPAKLVIDAATGRYVRFSLGANVWEFNALMGASSFDEQIWRVTLDVRNQTPAIHKLYCGYVALTVNEP